MIVRSATWGRGARDSKSPLFFVIVYDVSVATQPFPDKYLERGFFVDFFVLRLLLHLTQPSSAQSVPVVGSCGPFDMTVDVHSILALPCSSRSSAEKRGT